VVTGRVRRNTGKLDLPSISEVHARGYHDGQYYHSQAGERPVYMTSDKLPSLPLPNSLAPFSSGTSSPRVGSIASSVSSSSGSRSSFTSVASSNGPKTPSPTLPLSTSLTGHPSHTYDHISMSHAHQDMYYSQHMSAGQAAPPQTVTSGGLPHYAHQQPPLLQPGPGQYPPPPSPYGHQYGYTNGLTSPPAAPPVSGTMGGAGVLPPPTTLSAIPGQAANMPNQYTGFDTTGQIAPPGMKPRVTATLWEDEGSLCYQVEARGICVARREGTVTFPSGQDTAPIVLTKPVGRQPHDQRHKIAERGGNDSWTSRWNS
jgi:protein SOK2